MTSKKVVQYDRTKGIEFLGTRALLYPLNHPDSARVSNTTSTLTSARVNFYPDTGVLETEYSENVPHPV